MFFFLAEICQKSGLVVGTAYFGLCQNLGPNFFYLR
jgi:hypothetical protein